MGDSELTGAISEDAWRAEQVRTRRFEVLGSALGFVLTPLMGLPAFILANLTATGMTRYFAAVGWMALIFTPSTYLIVRSNTRQRRRADEIVEALTRRLAESVDAAHQEAVDRTAQAEQQRFYSRLTNAVEMAEDETEVLAVIERALHVVVPDAPAELLLADNSHAHLRRMATSGRFTSEPGCPVDAPDRCPAARRASMQVFTDSDQLDACPKLQNRPEGRISATCVPVSIMGRTVGVLHTAAPLDEPLSAPAAQALGTVANVAGSRLGLLRAMVDSQLQASTDSLTGLLNRRSFERELNQARARGPVAVGMVDVDHFKEVNDTFGHETGDRALRVFAEVLKASVRSGDLVGRHGGEEFVVAFPGATALNARKVLDDVRSRLGAALAAAALPKYTVSAGLVDARTDEDFLSLIARADTALFAAKSDGRDCVVIDGDHPAPEYLALAAEQLEG